MKPNDTDDLIQVDYGHLSKEGSLFVVNNIIADKSNIFIDTPKNPSHSDLYYIDPAIIEPESPNIAIRFFSRQLCKLSKLVMDYPSLNDTCTHVFADIYSD